MPLRTFVLVLTLVLAAAAAACGDDDADDIATPTPRSGSASFFPPLGDFEVVPGDPGEPQPPATADPSITPTVPHPASLAGPIMFMFCEPVYVEDESGAREVATVPHGMEVVYQPGSCEPEFEGDLVRVRAADGSVELVEPTFGQYRFGDPVEFIVWRPATGVLGGEDVIMTARFLKLFYMDFDFLGQPAVIFNMTDDGQDVFESMSTRLVGLPLAVFIDGSPLLGGDGRMIAPVIQSSIRDTGQTTGLSLVDAERLVALFDAGMLE